MLLHGLPVTKYEKGIKVFSMQKKKKKETHKTICSTLEKFQENKYSKFKEPTTL
jgi:hypothetical protein